MMTYIVMGLLMLLAALVWRDFTFRRMNDDLRFAIVQEKMVCRNARYLLEVERAEFYRAKHFVNMLSSEIQDWADYAQTLEEELNEKSEIGNAKPSTRGFNDDSHGQPTFDVPAKRLD